MEGYGVFGKHCDGFATRLAHGTETTAWGEAPRWRDVHDAMVILHRDCQG